MIILELFLVFLKVGAVSFGGGIGMLALIRDEVVSRGWMTESELLNMVAVSESTPGPIAVNIATFIGSDQGGFLGALAATLGVILPSFIIILIIAALISNLLKYAGVKAFIGGLRPCVIGLILATAVTMLLSTLVGFTTYNGGASVDVRGIIIFVILVSLAFVIKKVFKKKPSPIIMILISAGLGMVFYGVIK